MYTPIFVIDKQFFVPQYQLVFPTHVTGISIGISAENPMLSAPARNPDYRYRLGLVSPCWIISTSLTVPALRVSPILGFPPNIWFSTSAGFSAAGNVPASFPGSVGKRMGHSFLCPGTARTPWRPCGASSSWGPSWGPSR